MKKLSIFTIGLISIIAAFSLLQAQDSIEAEFIIISYDTGGQEIQVFNGGANEAPIECQGRNVSNCVVDLMKRFSVEGYEVISSAMATPDLYGGYEINPVMNIIMKKR